MTDNTSDDQKKRIQSATIVVTDTDEKENVRDRSPRYSVRGRMG